MRSQLVAQFMPFSSTYRANFNVFRQKVPYLNVSRQNRVAFISQALSVSLCLSKARYPAHSGSLWLSLAHSPALSGYFVVNFPLI